MRTRLSGHPMRRCQEKYKRIADRNFDILKSNPRHPPLHFKKAGRFRSARVGIHYRALAVEVEDGLLWF